MSTNLNDYIPAKQAAEEIGISYSLLMARLRKGKIPFIKPGDGWAVFIHKKDVAQAKNDQAKKNGDN